MTSPDLLADSYRDNDDYCFTRVYGFNLNKNECRNITHTATSARCDVGCFPSIRGLYYVYFNISHVLVCSKQVSSCDVHWLLQDLTQRECFDMRSTECVLQEEGHGAGKTWRVREKMPLCEAPSVFKAVF